MPTADVSDIARLLRDASANGVPIAPVRDRFAAGDVAGAYEVQRINTEHRVATGARVIGRKIGLTAKAVQRQLGVDQPDFGVLFDDMEIGDGEEIPYERVLQPKIEAEIALILERDLDAANPGVADVIRATGYVVPALEIVGSRIAKWDIGIVDTVADNASSALFVLGGPARRIDGLDLRICGMVLERAGEPVSFGAGAACLGHPLNAAVWLAKTLARNGAPLRAGDVVLTGALGPMVAVAPGDAFEARVNGVGSVRCAFAAPAGGRVGEPVSARADGGS